MIHDNVMTLSLTVYLNKDVAEKKGFLFLIYYFRFVNLNDFYV